MLSHVSFAIPWTVACQASLTMGFPSQEYWSRWPFPSPGIFPTQGLNSYFLHHGVDSYYSAIREAHVNYTITHTEQKTLKRIAIQAAHAAQYQKNKRPNQKMGKRTKQAFLHRRHQMASKHMKRCSILLTIREMQVKTTMRYHLTPVRMASI